jgi:hypothetical protein
MSKLIISCLLGIYFIIILKIFGKLDYTNWRWWVIIVPIILGHNILINY